MTTSHSYGLESLLQRFESLQRFRNNIASLLYILRMTSPGASFDSKDGSETNIHTVDDGCRFGGFGGTGTKEVDFFKLFDAITQMLKANRGTITGIYEEAITCCPRAEIRTLQRILGP